jgi:hypothetical protein
MSPRGGGHRRGRERDEVSRWKRINRPRSGRATAVTISDTKQTGRRRDYGGTAKISVKVVNVAIADAIPKEERSRGVGIIPASNQTGRADVPLSSRLPSGGLLSLEPMEDGYGN